MEQLAEDTHANGTTEFEETLETAKREHREVKEENDRLRARIKELETENEQLQQRAEAAEANADEHAKRKEALEDQLAKAAAALNADPQSVSIPEEIRRRVSNFEELTEMHEEALDQIEKLEAVLAQMHEKARELPDEVYDLEEDLKNRTRAHEDGPISIIQDGEVNFDKVWDVLEIVDEVAEERNKLEEAIEDIQFTARIHTDQ